MFMRLNLVTYRCKSSFKPIAVLFVGALVSALMGGPAFAKVSVTHEARQEKGYARIVLNFETLPKYESKVDDTIMVFRFSEEVDLNFSQLVSKLPTYLAVARVDPDGRAFRLAFIDSFKVNIMEAGNKVFIDILGRKWTGMPPNLPQDVVREITRRAAEIEAENRERERQQAALKKTYKAKVRVGSLPTFTRLVFDWNKFVTAKMERQDASVTVTFGQPVNLDVGRVKHNLPKYLKDISATERDAETVVKLNVDAKALVKGYREGDDYVVDISPSDVALSGELKALEKSIVDDDGNEVGRAEVQLYSNDDGSQKETGNSKENDKLKLVRSTYSSFNPDAFELNIFGDSDGDSAERSVQIDISNYKRDEMKKGDDPLASNKNTEGRAGQNSKVMQPLLVEKPNHSQIVFPFHEGVAAAGFIRGDTVWIVFDSFKEIDLSKVMAAKSNKIKDVRKTRLHNGQLILIKLAQPHLFALEHENFVWTAKIGDMVTAKAKAFQIRRRTNADKQRYVSVAVERPGHLYWLKDEDIGDRVGVVTSFPPVGQLSKPQRFVEFSTFGTAHGIAFLPKTDDLEVRIGFQEVVIKRSRGLYLSDEAVVEKLIRQSSGPERSIPDLGFINFNEWRYAGNGSFMDQMGSFENRIALADEKTKYEAKKNYAQFLLANELGLETLGMVQNIVREMPEKQNDADLRVMQGAANVMVYRPKEAVKSLSLGALYNNEHASLWRGMAKQMLEQWSDALRQFRGGADAMSYYPEDQKARFLLGAAKSAMALRNYALTKQYLRDVSANTGEKDIDVNNMLLNAQYLAGTGDMEAAQRLYERVVDSDVAPAVAKAKIDLLRLKLKNDAIKAEDAIVQLEGMQLMWRGDSTELEMLSLLSELYADKGDYRSAFANMKQAVKAYPTDENAMRIQDDMAKVFKSLFLQNRVTDMRPIEALSLFYDYRELTPIGRAGDEMIRMLADRLIDVDLLDQAAELLDHQVTNRVHGAARSQVAAKLAMVYLMNRKPELALQTIGRTRQPNLPKQVKRARDILEARSLSELSQVDGAIDILNRMEGSEIERMKADAYWNAQQWGKSGEQLEKILGSSWNRGEGLQPFERKDVLRSAISYSLAQDAFALSRLRKKFYNKMVNSPDASAFIVFTKPVKKDGEAYKRLAKDIAAINSLDTFMKQYRDFYKDSLSNDEVSKAGQDEVSSGPSEREG